jgi:hypothetical protein
MDEFGICFCNISQHTNTSIATIWQANLYVCLHKSLPFSWYTYIIGTENRSLCKMLFLMSFHEGFFLHHCHLNDFFKVYYCKPEKPSSGDRVLNRDLLISRQTLNNAEFQITCVSAYFTLQKQLNTHHISNLLRSFTHAIN